jgi:membrane-associated protease RseP (regulator of RpoE activity)
LINTLPDSDPQSWPEVVNFFAEAPSKYFVLVADAVQKLFTSTEHLSYGLSFSLSLLFILLSHEMGHYVACRIYRVDATLPLFIPTPPMIGPAGTFGAFIKIKSPMPSRRAVFDIGVAGPIAGFIALVPIAIIGVATMQPASPAQLSAPGGIVFADPLMMKLIASFFNVDLARSVGNPFYFAAWVGLLVTALNLIPSGQLDGGHVLYAVLGKQVHRWTGIIAFFIMATLSVLGFLYYNSPSGSGAMGPIAARQKKKGRSLSFLTDLYIVLFAVPASDQLVAPSGNSPLISRTILCTSSWPSSAIIKKS